MSEVWRGNDDNLPAKYFLSGAKKSYRSQIVKIGRLFLFYRSPKTESCSLRELALKSRAVTALLILFAFLLTYRSDCIAQTVREITDQNVEFRVGNLQYSIPRAYLATPYFFKGGDFEFVTIRVDVSNYPFSPGGDKCKNIPPSQCPVIEPRILGTGIESTNYTEIIDRQKKYMQMIGNFFGFDVYRYRSEKSQAPDLLYRELDGRDLLFSCARKSAQMGGDYWECRGNVRTKLGSHFYYTFLPSYIGRISDIQMGLVNLIDSFVIRKE